MATKKELEMRIKELEGTLDTMHIEMTEMTSYVAKLSDHVLRLAQILKDRGVL